MTLSAANLWSEPPQLGRLAGVEEARLSATPFDGLLPDDGLIAQCQTRYGLDLDAVFLSPPPMSGDLWGLLPIDDARLAIFCADICGHGVAVAPHTRYLHAVLHASKELLDRPDEVLGQLNRFLHHLLPRGQFAAIFYGVIDFADDSLTYACSTFMPQLWRAGEGQAFSHLDGEGLPLGFVSEATYDVYRRAFPPGAGLVIYSDAVVETPLPPKAVFTPDSLCVAVNALPVDVGARQVNKAVIDALDLGVNRLCDDLTLVSLFRRVTNGSGPVAFANP